MLRVIKKLVMLLQIPQKHNYQTVESNPLSSQLLPPSADEDPFPCQKIDRSINSNRNFFEGSKLNNGYAGTLFRKENQEAVLTEQNAEDALLVRFKSSLSRIVGLIKRYALIKFRDFHRLANVTYFPVTDVLIGGLMWMWYEGQMNITESAVNLYVCELILWIILNATQFEACFNFLEELQSRNIVNLFASTLHLREWFIASFLLSLFESLTAAALCGIIAYFVFSFSLLSFGWYLPCFFILLVLSGWIMALVTISVLVYYGQRLTVLLWALPYFILPLSAAYYPVESLPRILQYVSLLIPTTHLFEGVRCFFATHVMPVEYFVMSLLLNILYLICAILFFNFMFKKSKQQGLAQLEND